MWQSAESSTHPLSNLRSSLPIVSITTSRSGAQNAIRESGTAWRFERKDDDMQTSAPRAGAGDKMARLRHLQPDYTPILSILQDDGRLTLAIATSFTILNPGDFAWRAPCGILARGIGAGRTQTFFASGANTMTIKEMEETYQRLRDQLLNGDLDEERFRAVVDLLRFEDKLGYEWKIGWHTGKWYRYDQGQWIQGTPVEGKRRKDRTDTAKKQQTTSAARRFSSTPCLVVMLVGLLLAASALLIFAWNVDWWQESPEGTTAAAAATQVEEATVAPSVRTGADSA